MENFMNPEFKTETTNSASRKNSEMVAEAKNTIEVLNLQQKLDLKDFLKDNSEQVRAYELNDGTLQNLKKLRKYSSFTHFYIYIE